MKRLTLKFIGPDSPEKPQRWGSGNFPAGRSTPPSQKSPASEGPGDERQRFGPSWVNDPFATPLDAGDQGVASSVNSRLYGNYPPTAIQIAPIPITPRGFP